jgi:hypothetical protein
MTGLSGIAARSATAVAAQARAPPRPGSGGSSPAPPVPQTEHLALDAQVPPARVLPCQLLNQPADLLWDRRAWCLRIGPLLSDQAAVPGQQAAWGCDPVQPKAAGHQPCQRGEYRPVSPVRPRAGDLPPQHRDLVAEDQDLYVLGGVAARQQGKPAERADYGQVDESDEHERRA